MKPGPLEASLDRKRERSRIWGRRRRQTHPHLYAKWNRKHRTGWSQEMVDAAWRAQNGRCAQCDVPMLARGKQPSSVVCERGRTTMRCRGCHSRDISQWKRKAS